MYGNICYDTRDQYINFPWSSETEVNPRSGVAGPPTLALGVDEEAGFNSLRTLHHRWPGKYRCERFAGMLNRAING